MSGSTSDLPHLPDDMRPALRQFLRHQSTLALATAGEDDGRPQVAPVFFVCDEAFNFYWISSPDSRHSMNLGDWNDVAGAVWAQTWTWSGIKGVQVEGDAMPIDGEDERERALALYKAKFEVVNDRLLTLLDLSVMYVLRPRWLRWMDNERRFGYRQEFSLVLPDDGPPDDA